MSKIENSKIKSCLSLNKDLKKFLNDLSENTTIPSSEIINKILFFFRRNPAKLKEILREELGLNEEVTQK